MNYAVIDQNGNVVNIIVYDGFSPYNPGVGMTLALSDIAGVGWTYANGVFTNPNNGG